MTVHQSVLDILQENTWTDTDEKTILEPFTFINSTPGKDIRSKLIRAFNKWLNVPEEQVKVILRILDMINAATLMIDDIEDDSQMRRGGPVAHKVYGVPSTINSANYVYFLVYQELLALRSNPEWCTPNKDLDAIVTDELLSMHRGQGLEMFWRDTLKCPTEAEYIKMVNGKTSGLLRMGIKLMMACSTTNTDIDYIPLVNLFGVFGQIRDDLMNLDSTEYTNNKGFADDLTEGKFSFPIIHGMQANTSSHLLLNVLQKRPRTPTLKVNAINYLRNHTKSFEYAFEVLDDLEVQTRAEIARLGGNEELEKFMDWMHVEKGKLE